MSAATAAAVPPRNTPKKWFSQIAIAESFDYRLWSLDEAMGVAPGVCHSIWVMCRHEADRAEDRKVSQFVAELARLYRLAVEVVRSIIEALAECGGALGAAVTAMRRAADTRLLAERNRLLARNRMRRWRARKRLADAQTRAGQGALLMPIAGSIGTTATIGAETGSVTRAKTPAKPPFLSGAPSVTEASGGERPNRNAPSKPLEIRADPPRELESEIESENTLTGRGAPPASETEPAARPAHVLDYKNVREEFERFWEAYPVQAKKARARDAFARARRIVSAAEIMAGLDRYRRVKPEWQQWAHPSSWLADRRWEDHPEAKPAAPPAPQQRDILDFHIERIRNGQTRLRHLAPNIQAALRARGISEADECEAAA